MLVSEGYRSTLGDAALERGRWPIFDASPGSASLHLQTPAMHPGRAHGNDERCAKPGPVPSAF